MSSLDKQPSVRGTILKASEQQVLDSTTSKQIGGANATTTVPAGMDMLLGIYAHMWPTTPTNDQADNVWGYLDTEDGFNLKPFEFLFPNKGCAGDTTSSVHSVPGIFYPVNCPVTPGGRIAAYAQAYENATEEPYVQVTYMFGKNLVLPKCMDDHPGRQRWRKVGHTPAATVAAGFTPENQYQFTLSAQGGAITEVGGLYWTTTQTVAACAGGATMQINSADVPVMPMDFNMNAFGAALGIASSHDGSDGVTRRPCSAFGEKVVHIDAQMVTDGGTAITTGYFVSMVEFVRRGE
jgi:hypothetical protein